LYSKRGGIGRKEGKQKRRKEEKKERRGKIGHRGLELREV